MRLDTLRTLVAKLGAVSSLCPFHVARLGGFIGMISLAIAIAASDLLWLRAVLSAPLTGTIATELQLPRTLQARAGAVVAEAGRSDFYGLFRLAVA